MLPLHDLAVDQRLPPVTQRAVQRDVFRAPAFLVGDRLLWGMIARLASALPRREQEPREGFPYGR
jgi:2-hydroxychromene-2-carboxylate isomerase